MPHKTFFWFFFPSGLAMIIFIGLPIFSSFFQSMHIEPEQVLIEVETCDPFGCETEVQVDQEATTINREANPLGRFNGFGTYTDRNHLAFNEISDSWNKQIKMGDFISDVLNLPFYKSLLFTLTFCFAVTPCVIVLGFIVALSVNVIAKSIKGPIIFGTILPMIVTPLIGSLVLFWMIDSQGILGAAIQILFDDPNLSLKSSKSLTWIMLIVYGIWHNTPFAFIVFYAGLQTVNKETLESAVIDGANRFERLRYIVIPHLMPLIIFVSLIHLMDSYRVFEEIVAFSSQAYVISLQWLTYDFLTPDDTGNRLINRASTSAMLTMVGVTIIILPLLKKTWEDYREGKL